MTDANANAGVRVPKPKDIDDLLAELPDHARPVSEALLTRRSVRGFLSDPVPRDTVEHILRTAARAPSGSNIQPWHVVAVTGNVRDEVAAAVRHAATTDAEAHTAQYVYYPQTWRAPYIDRRRATGWGLYGTLGIEKGDKARMAAQHMRNFDLFDAPVGLFITMDRDMETGSWLDTGTFVQSIMIAARAHGLDTCPQQAWSRYWRVIFPLLDIADDQILVCGMALGRADPHAPANDFWTEREPLASYARLEGFGDASP
ncbi:MAG: nitroreductase [Pseudomonadota bacterium]